MSLLFGNDKAEDEVEVGENQDQETSEDGEVETETETDEDGEVKESYQARLRKRQIAAATIIKDVIAKAGIKLNAEEQAAMDLLGHASQRTGGFGTPVINKIFGDNLVVGAKATTLDVFQKTGKGYAEIRQLLKKWAEKGITVEYDEASTSYVIKALA